MLIIPISGKLSWRNPPAVTIALIVVNVLVFFIFQLGEDEKFMQAHEYYFKSGLAEIELPRYLDYRESRSEDPEEDFSLPEDEDERAMAKFHYYMEMMTDHDFQTMLRQDEIVRADDPVYAEWKSLRTNYNEKVSRIFMMKYGLIPAHHKPLTFLTCMFLHGGVGHLVGNMIFLWIMGAMIEMGCGRSPYFVLYILTGIAASAAFWVFNMESLRPLVGASGAIAGLMGAVTVLYGRKKIRMFLTLGFYFNYLKFPAIALLPFWIGKELYQMFSYEMSPVAYLAHLGGLVSGGLLGFVILKIPGLVDKDAFEEAPEDKISPLVEKALTRVRDLDMEGGRRLLEEALALDPENIDALTHLFHVAAYDPEKPLFHETARKLLSLLSKSPGTHERAYEIYKEYLERGGRPKLSPDLYIHLSLAFAGRGHTTASRKILAMLIKNRPDLPGIPTALLKLAGAYREKGMPDRWRKFLKIIPARYPASPEAEIAKRSLK
ncbi:MAG: rhomboid family intramembrane serine protease [Desulfobacterales bacterium]|nr:rhomboid family intramembrane serine protease [Desulfobacterales bacterium]